MSKTNTLSNKSSQLSRARAQSINTEQKLQALLIADSFDEFYRPISLELPRALMPLVNVPMIDYTLEWLCSCGVEEIFVFCCAHRDLIQQHIESSRWSKSDSRVSVRCVMSRGVNNLGSCMREMYKNQLLKSDFVLCMADVVCNVPLQPILKQHNARRECDKEAIMTLLFQTQTRHNMEVAKLYQHPHIRHLVHTFQTQKHPVQDRNTSAAYTGNERSHDNVNVDDDDDDDDDSDSDVDNDASGGVDGDNETGDDDAAVAEDSTSQPLLTHPDDVTVALDAETGQLLLYDTTSLTPTLQLDSTILREHSNGIQFRNDLVNTHIAICSLDVLFHFQDNFDHQTLSQFLRGVVRQEILNAKVFAHVVTPPYYVARANCLRAYNTICRDIVTRWTYPLVPDNNLVFTNHNTVTTYTMSRAYIYTEQNVTLARSCILAEEVVVGDGTHIGEHSFITHSVIGRLCRIGSHVRIVGSYIWDNVIVEDHVTITDSIVCNGAVLKRNVVIPKGSLISFNVVIGEGVNTLKTYSKVTRYGLATDGREGKTVKTPRQFSSDSEASQSNDEIGSLSRGVTEKSSRRDLIVSRFRDVNLGREGVGRLWVERERQSYVTLLRTLNQNRNPNQPPIEENNFLRHTDLVLSDDIIELLRKTHRSDSTFTTTNGNGDATVGTHSLNQSLITESESESESEIGRVDEIESDEENTTSKKKDLIKSNSSKMYISDLQRFDREVQETVRRGVRERHSLDNIVLEINSLKYAYDTTFLDCASSILIALVSLIEEADFNNSLKSIFKTWGPLLRNFLDTQEDQVELIFKIQEICEQQSQSKLAKAFQIILHILYDGDVLDEEAILQWAKEVQNATDADKTFLHQCDSFLRWLAEAEEESSDSA